MKSPMKRIMAGRKCIYLYLYAKDLQHILAGMDGFQMSIKRPTSGGQMHDQEAAVLQTFHLERSSFFYLSALMVRT